MKPIRLSMLLLVAVLWLVATTNPARAETAPTTCTHNPVTHLSGRIVLDLNHNLWPEAAEGVSGISVRLFNINSGSTLLQSVETDSAGCYHFNRTMMATGQPHRITWDAPHVSARLMHDPDAAGAPQDLAPRYEFIAQAGAPYETDVVYRATPIAPHLTFCPSTLGSDSDLGGAVALDANDNGRADPGEGIAGALVTLAVNHPSQITAQTTTDLNGCYRLPRNSVAPDGMSGDPTARDPMTTLMYVRVTLPGALGAELVESYDPNGRQTAGMFREIFTANNGTFESDLLYRNPNAPTAVTVSSLNSFPAHLPIPAPAAFVLAGAALLGAIIVLRRR
jgi:hypothetical protein